MPTVQCPFPNCPYVTPDLDPSVVAALLTTHAMVHSQAPQARSTTKPKEYERPTITLGGSTEDWAYFLTRWKEYCDGTKIIGQDRVLQLLECCESQLRRDITRAAGGSLTAKTEEEVLAAIKALAVREENTMVARAALHGMKQDREESIRAFCARVRGQANTCKFTATFPACNTDVSYTDSTIRDNCQENWQTRTYN